MASITRSVGAQGANRRKDVETVQRLLNRHLTSIGRHRPLVVDGLVGSETISAIVEFQARVVGMTTPDGKVDPAGRTLKELNRTRLSLVQLPEDGLGYYNYTYVAKQFGTTKTIRSVKAVARRFHSDTGGEIGIGHISLENGGKFPPHKSHQRGLDVDIRPLRADGYRRAVTIVDDAYSRVQTRRLVEALYEDRNLNKILFNDSKIAGVTEWTGHDNHLHVRFHD